MIISKIFFCIQKEIQFFVVPKLDYHKKNVMNIKLRSLVFRQRVSKNMMSTYKSIQKTYIELLSLANFNFILQIAIEKHITKCQKGK